MNDPYWTLGVSRKATHDEIRSMYRKLAQIYHPDRGGSHEHMAQLNQAYEILGDPLRRAAYDQASQRPVPSPARSPTPPPRASWESPRQRYYAPPKTRPQVVGYPTIWKHWVAGVPAAFFLAGGLLEFFTADPGVWGIFDMLSAAVGIGLAGGTFFVVRVSLGP